MSAPWPPPPDLDSIKELVRNSDTEEFILNGSPSDEYDGEAEQLFAAIGRFPTQDLIAPRILPHLERIWRESFAYDEADLSVSCPALQELAAQIARFFGPDAVPATRERHL
jgi:hypothetical protein